MIFNKRSIAMLGWLCTGIVACSTQPAEARNQVFKCGRSTIVLQDSASAAQISQQPDPYSREQTGFDRSIRLDRTTQNSEQDYLAEAAQNVQNWTPQEEQTIQAAFASIDSMARSQKYNLHLPDTILLIKTNAAEEFNAEGYTRLNRIMLNPGVQAIDLHLVAHELFHVISRYNPALRDRVYSVFHFKPCNNIVYKPALNNQVITNPDCPFIAHYLTVDMEGKKHDVALVLYSSNNYTKGYTAGQYMNLGLLELTGDKKHKQPLLKDGKPVMYSIEQVPDFMAQVGNNTQYILHPEEISAEHFAMIMAGKTAELPQQELVKGVQSALRK